MGVPLPAGAIRLPSGAVSIPPSSVPNDQRLIVSQVVFSPNPVASRRGPVTVRVKVTDTRGYLVRDVVVFVRSTPRVTSGSRLLTATDGWMTAQLVPLRTFPLRKQGHVQFFVKAYRSGDPALGGSPVPARSGCVRRRVAERRQGGPRSGPRSWIAKLAERSPPRVGLALGVLVRLDVQVLAAGRAQPGALGAAEDLLG